MLSGIIYFQYIFILCNNNKKKSLKNYFNNLMNPSAKTILHKSAEFYFNNTII